MKYSKSISKTLGILLLMIVMVVPNVVQAKKVDYYSHYAEESIKSLLSKGIVSGYPDGTYRPDESISRAEFIAIINKAFNIQEIGKINFKDVKKTDWFYKDVEKAVAEAYISGYEDGTLKPNNPITRQEASVVLGKLFAKIENKQAVWEYATRITDWDNIPSWSKSDINKMVKNKIMWLDNDNGFRYKDNLTRGEMAISIDKILEIQDNNAEDKQGVEIGIGDIEIKTSHNKEDFMQLVFRKDRIDIFGGIKGYGKDIDIMIGGDDYSERDELQTIDGKYEGSFKLPNIDGQHYISIWIRIGPRTNQLIGQFPFKIEDGKIEIEIEQSNILEYNKEVYESRNHMKATYLNTDYIKNKDKLNSLLENIIDRDDSDYRKAYKIANWVSENIYYNYDYYYHKKNNLYISPEDVLEHRYTVCEGYANLTDVLMRLAGIPSRKVPGYALGVGASVSDLSTVGNQTNHVWNEVLVDGRWVIIDTTWNSSNKREDDVNIYKEATKKYFDITIEGLSNTHKL